MQPSVTIKQLTVMLGKNYPALQAISLELAPGRITGFIGPSGAGKTTLIRAIAGRQKITRGQLRVFGLPAGSPALRHRVSYMPQETSVYEDLTVLENLRYFAAMGGQRRAAAKQTVHSVLETVDLAAQANRLVSNLSSGQKQRVSLAGALLARPELMVLDEPTVGLDPVLREQLWKLFRELAGGGTTVIISSHVMDEAERCDDLVLLRDGQVLAHSTPAELCRQTGTKTVEQGFLKLVEAKL
jgi:ABC-2 type transport system ATP-binding protein